MAKAYYNEFDPFAAAWLRELISAGLIAPGEVDERSIVDVQPSDLEGYTQCHFFAGIGGWSLALRMAGWADETPVWTGSCPCQPFSLAGKGRGTDDVRHLWPEYFRLITECSAPVCFGEQVASPLGRTWLGGVRNDLESLGRRFGAAYLCAYSVRSPHERLRAFWASDSPGDGREGLQRRTQAQVQKDRTPKTLGSWHGTGNPFEQWPQLLAGTCVRRMDDGVSSCLDVRPSLRGYGNAIVPELAAEFIRAFLEAKEMMAG